MGGGSAMMDMNKRYQQNRALLNHTSAFEKLKDHYQHTPGHAHARRPDVEGLECWHLQRDINRKRERWWVRIIYGLLGILSAVLIGLLS